MGADVGHTQLAEAYGAKGLHLRRAADVDRVLQAAMEYNDGPCLIDAEVVKEGHVFPMVPAGASLREMIVDPPRIEVDEEGEPS